MLERQSIKTAPKADGARVSGARIMLSDGQNDPAGYWRNPVYMVDAAGAAG